MRLIDYIFGSRRGRGANRIEREAMVDPFTADAIEGYDSVYGNHSDRLAELAQLVERRSLKPRGGRRNGRRLSTIVWSAAAMVAVVAGITLLYIYRPGALHSEGPVALTTESAEEQPASGELLAQKEEGISRFSIGRAADSVEQPTAPAEESGALPTGSEQAEEQPFMILNFVEEDLSEYNVQEVTETVHSSDAVPAKASTPTASVSRTMSAEESVSVAEEVENPDFMRYFRENRKITTDEEGRIARGTVVAEFRVNDRGVPSEIRIVTGITSRINREVIELLTSGPAWEPTEGVRIRTVLRYD